MHSKWVAYTANRQTHTQSAENASQRACVFTIRVVYQLSTDTLTHIEAHGAIAYAMTRAWLAFVVAIARVYVFAKSCGECVV